MALLKLQFAGSRRLSYFYKTNFDLPRQKIYFICRINNKIKLYGLSCIGINERQFAGRT